MTIQLAMVGVVVEDMARALAFYRLLGLEIPQEADGERFVMHRMASGVTIFFDTVFIAASDPERERAPSGSYNTVLEFYAGTRDAVDATHAELVAHGFTSAKPRGSRRARTPRSSRILTATSSCSPQRIPTPTSDVVDEYSSVTDGRVESGEVVGALDLDDTE